MASFRRPRRFPFRLPFLFLPLVLACVREGPPPPPPGPTVTVESGTSLPAPEAEAPTPDNQPLSRDEVLDMALPDKFEHIAFLSPQDVEYAVGVPREKEILPDREIWYYDVLAHGPGGGRAGYPAVHFMGGQVRAVVYYPLESFRDLVATAGLNKKWKAFSGARPRTFTFDESFGSSRGKSKDEVLEAFGEPDQRHVIHGYEVWQYDTLIVDQGRKGTLALRFENGKVAEASGT